jgi:hypothetical protein
MATSIQTEQEINFPTNFHGSTQPIFSSSSYTQFTVASIQERSQDDTINITQYSPTTVNITVAGAGGILTSSVLPGTIATSGTAVTGTGTTFTTSFQVGDVISCSAGNGNITAISSDTSLTCAASFSSNSSGLSYQRGGSAMQTFYYLYAISAANGIDATLALSTRSVASGDTLVDLPSGYSKYRQIPFAVRTDSTTPNGQLLPFKVSGGWPYRPAIFYNASFYANNTYVGAQVFLGTAPTTFTNVSCSSTIPKISRMGFFTIQNLVSATWQYYIKDPDDTSSAWGQLDVNNTSSASIKLRCGINSSQQVSHCQMGTSRSKVIYVVGYIVTEVP